MLRVANCEMDLSIRESDGRTSVSGQIISHGHQLPRPTWVHLLRAAGEIVAHARTNCIGEFQFADVPSGSLILRVEDPAFSLPIACGDGTQPLTTPDIGQIASELRDLNQAFQARLAQTISQAAGLEKEHEEELKRALAACASEHAELETRLATAKDVPETHKEIQRVEMLIAENNRRIAELMIGPSVELREITRKNMQQEELKAYLKGLRYGLSEAELRGHGVSPADPEVGLAS